MNFVCLASIEYNKKKWGGEITMNYFLNVALKELS